MSRLSAVSVEPLHSDFKRTNRAPKVAGSPGSRARCLRTCLGSLTAQGPAIYFAAQYPACTYPCQRFACVLTGADA
jgi:hypothetical protein